MVLCSAAEEVGKAEIERRNGQCRKCARLRGNTYIHSKADITLGKYEYEEVEEVRVEIRKRHVLWRLGLVLGLRFEVEV